MKKENDLQPQRTEEDSKHTPCPYLSSHSENICTRLAANGLDSNVSVFDLEHFCKGYPIRCYYYRSSEHNKR